MESKEFSERLSALSPQQKALFELRRKQIGQAAAKARAIPRREQSGPCPASFEQERLWFIQHLYPDSAGYNISNGLTLDGSLDVDALERGLNEIVRRHEILRTGFVTIDGRPMQAIAPGLMIELPVIDLRGMAQSERQAESRRLATLQAQQPFELSEPPLFRVSLLRLSDERYEMALTMHHIVTDWWSFGIFYEELTRLYEAFSTAKPSPLPELPIQYADFAAWQRQWLQGEVLAEHLSYWKRRLSGSPPHLELPADYPRPPVQGFDGRRYFFTLPRFLSTKLKALAQQEGVTFFILLLAAFKAFLCRHSGQHDIVVGSPVSNRTLSETEGLIGYFLDMMALRADLSGDPAFREIVGRVREAVMGAYDHQGLPLGMLIESLRIQRDLSHMPLFQVSFIFVHSDWKSEGLSSSDNSSAKTSALSVNGLEIDTGLSRFDLTLAVTDAPDDLACFFEYNTDLFEPATIERMGEQWLTLLGGIVTNPDERLSKLPLLSKGEQRLLLTEWNDTAADYSNEQCIHHLFESQARRSPEAIAAVCGDDSISYFDLNRRAGQLASYLQAAGVGPETLVAICVNRSIEMLVAAFGVLKAGGAYVPIDPIQPTERIAFILEDARVSVVLTQQELSDKLTGCKAKSICLDVCGEIFDREITRLSVNELTPDNLAYVIYTSGSTGKPKGVQVSHRAFVNLLDAMRREIEIGDRDVMASVTTLSFDIAGLELYLPLIAGACVAVMKSEEVLDGVVLAESLSSRGVTVMQATPVTWRMLLKAGWRSRQRMKALCGGDVLTRELAEELLERGCDLRNLFGPTETAVWSVMHRVDSAGGAIPIGRPIANTTAYILDNRLDPVPIGAPGELCIGGIGLARGYHNRPDITAEKFIANPFSNEPGARLYRTGDVARRLPGGEIEFLGRMDHQVKIRGFRVELGEIETTLVNHPAIAECAVMARKDSSGEKSLVAYVVCEQGEKITISELREFLMESLPEYMAPGALMLLESIPHTASGKIDYRALPVPDGFRPKMAAQHIEPRTEMERVIANVWQETLGVEKVGINDNFFDLGGHSILIMQVRDRLRRASDKDLPVIEMFRYPTVSLLAERLSQEPNQQEPLQKIPLRGEARRESMARQRLYRRNRRTIIQESK